MAEALTPDAEINERKLAAEQRINKEWQSFQEETERKGPEENLRSLFLVELPDDGSQAMESSLRSQVEINQEKIKSPAKLDREIVELVILNNELKTRLFEMRPPSEKHQTPGGSIEVSFRGISPAREIVFDK
jgi:hypothetical protein